MYIGNGASKLSELSYVGKGADDATLASAKSYTDENRGIIATYKNPDEAFQNAKTNELYYDTYYGALCKYNGNYTVTQMAPSLTNFNTISLQVETNRTSIISHGSSITTLESTKQNKLYRHQITLSVNPTYLTYCNLKTDSTSVTTKQNIFYFYIYSTYSGKYTNTNFPMQDYYTIAQPNVFGSVYVEVLSESTAGTGRGDISSVRVSALYVSNSKEVTNEYAISIFGSESMYYSISDSVSEVS